MLMPKAAMDKDHSLSAFENDVGLSEDVLRV
jgi:hypothetical protein